MNALPKAILLLCVGALLGVPLGMQWQKSLTDRLTTIDEYDDNEDGQTDNIFSYREGVQEWHKCDLNFDGQYDAFEYYTNGQLARAEMDADYDGELDGWGTYRHGRLIFWSYNVDANPAPDVFEYHQDGQLKLLVWRPNDGTLVTRIDYYNQWEKLQELRDKDGDGLFEHMRKFDEFEEAIGEETLTKPISAQEALDQVTKKK